MNEKEQRIHDGLNALAPVLATFFKAALELKEGNNEVKSYLLAHLAREINGGIFDVLTPDKDLDNHDKIKIILNTDEENETSRAWLEKTKKVLFKFAHRNQVWEKPRTPDAFDKEWDEYVEILEHLVGNHYAIGDRIDAILKQDNPNKATVGTLKNLIQTRVWYLYFFNNLKSPKWLQELTKQGYFDSSNIPAPEQNEDGGIQHPRWVVLNYIKNLIQNLDSNDLDTQKLLILIANQWIKFFIKNPDHLNANVDYVILKIIISVEDDLIKDKHFEFIINIIKVGWYGFVSHEFENLIVKFIKSGNSTLMIKCLDVLFAYKLEPSSYFESDNATTIFDGYYFKKYIQEHSEPIIQLCGQEVVEHSIAKIEEAIQDDEKLFSKLSVSAILDEDDQMSLDDKYDCQLTFFTRDALLNQSIEYLDEVIPKLLNKEHPIFKRLALHTITKRYSEIEPHFWQFDLNTIDYNLKLEVFKLFKKCHTHFNGEQYEKILNWIENRKYFTPDEYSAENKKRSIAASKIEWLQSIEDSGNQKIIEAIETQRKINDVTHDHPGHDTWHSGVIVGHRSPINVDDLSQFSFGEVIQYYDEFKSSHKGFMGPSVEGLSQTIQTDVGNQIDKYTTDKALLKTADIYFLDSICDGLRKKLEEEIIPVKFDILLDVIWDHLKQYEFWTLFNKENNQNRQFIYSYLRFINQILRSDKVEISDSNFEIIKHTFLQIHKEDETFPYASEDLNLSTLNHTKGIIYASFVELSLRVKRMDADANWDSEIKAVFEQELNKESIVPLFFNSLGRYLDNLLFIDKDWYEANFYKIFPLDKEEAWSASFNSYFFYSSHVYQNRFKRFSDDGHFKKLFDNPELVTSNAQNRICQHILIAYLDKQINLGFDEEPFSTLLAIESEDSYENIIRFFWNNNVSKPNIEKLRLLWLHIYKTKDKIKDPELANYFLSGCTKWMQHFKDLDDELFEAIKEGVINLTERDSYFFFEYLNKIIDNNLEKSGELLVAAFRKDATYDLSRGLIADMVEKLYQNDFKEYADEICLLYIKHNQLFLRDLYKKYNK